VCAATLFPWLGWVAADADAAPPRTAMAEMTPARRIRFIP
jgi:hypothetical protein